MYVTDAKNKCNMAVGLFNRRTVGIFRRISTGLIGSNRLDMIIAVGPCIYIDTRNDENFMREAAQKNY